eukprot:COSAG02_NODE_6074_length_3820_cov_2.789573_5_plen_84_part_00
MLLAWLHTIAGLLQMCIVLPIKFSVNRLHVDALARLISLLQQSRQRRLHGLRLLACTALLPAVSTALAASMSSFARFAVARCL